MDGNRRAVVRSGRGRSKMSRAVVRCRHDRSWERSLVGSAAPIAAFVAITQAAGGTGQNPKRKRRAAATAEDGGGRLFCFAMQSARFNQNVYSRRWRAAENS